MAEEKATGEPVEESTQSPALVEETEGDEVTTIDATVTDDETTEQSQGEATTLDEESSGEAEDDSTGEDLPAEEESLAEYLRGDERKTGVQKRIDKLVAQNKALEEKLTQLEAKQPKSEQPEYTDMQLRQAMKKAIADGDADLVDDIMRYREERLEKRLIQKYQEARKQEAEQAQAMQKEWTSIVDSHSDLWDNNEAELYPGSHKELNLTNPNSLLYRITLHLLQGYSFDKDGKKFIDEELRKHYMRPGGQRLAVADAIKTILKGKNVKSSSKKEKVLEKKLAKAKRKTSLGSSSGAVKQDKKTFVPRNDRERLDDYIKERKKMQAERSSL